MYNLKHPVLLWEMQPQIQAEPPPPCNLGITNWPKSCFSIDDLKIRFIAEDDFVPIFYGPELFGTIDCLEIFLRSSNAFLRNIERLTYLTVPFTSFHHTNNLPSNRLGYAFSSHYFNYQLITN